MDFVKVPGISGFRQAEKTRPCRLWPLLEHGYKARHGLHRSRGPDGDKRIALFQSVINEVELIRLLTKPANIGPHQRSASAARQRACRITIVVIERWTATSGGTPAFKQFAVDVDHVFRACGFMQTIHVLRAEKQSAVPGLFAPPGQCNMRCVGFGIAGARTTVRVILPNQSRVLLPGFNVRQFVMAVAAPTGSLKDRNPALRADSSAGQDEYATALLHANCSLSAVKSGL